MIVLNDDFFLFSVAYVAYFVVIGIVSTLAFAVTGIFSMALSLRPVSGAEQLNTTNVSGFVQGLLAKLTVLITQSVVYVFRTFMVLFPFLVILILLSAIHDNYPTLMVYLEEGYNKFLAESSTISAIRSSTWILKISAEVLVPIWNFVIDTTKRVFINVLKLVLSDLDAKDLVRNIFLNIGESLYDMASAAFAWMQFNWQCRFFQWHDDVAITPDTSVPCLDFENRELKLETGILKTQMAASSFIRLFTQLCPLSLGFVDVLMYPLSRPELGMVLSDAINVFIQLVWDIWDTTQLRCRLVVQDKHSLFYCVPDVSPVFFYVKRLLANAGELLDLWIQRANDAVLSIFLRRKLSQNVAVGDELLAASQLDAQFPNEDYTVLRMNDYTIAYTNGRKVIWRAPVATGNRVLESAFTPPVEIRHGVVPISFAKTIDEVDYDGEERTSIMGCSCRMDGGQVKISCSVARFSVSEGPEHADGDAQYVIPVNFENGLTPGYLTCDSIQISVQPVRFPQISAFENDDRQESREFAFGSSASECVQDSRKCNNVDALVFVKPLCERARSFRYNGHSQEAVNTNRAACIEGTSFSSCFPYCLAMHHRGKGVYPMTLYGKRTIEGGVWRTNTRCSVTGGGGNLHVLTQKEANDEESPQNLITANEGDGDTTSCRSATSYVSTETDMLSTNASLTVPEVEMSFYEWAWNQPVFFAGDAVMVPSCSIQNGDCVWTADVMRLTSTVLGKYEVRKVIDKIPSISASSGWQLDSSPTSHLFRIPYATSDVFASQNFGVQTRTGFFYAVNPDLDVIAPEYLQDCNDDTKLTSIGDDGDSIFRSARVFMTRPMYECSLGEVVIERNQLFYNELLARSCSRNLTREVVFDGNDRFWNSENMETDSRHNLFIQSMSLFDDLNVLVITKHGFLKYIKHDVGMRTPNDPDCQYPEASRATTRLYFIHTRTLAMRKDVPWPMKKTPKIERLVPDIMTLLSKSMIITAEVGELVINNYALNLFGIVEQKLQNSTQQEVALKLNHGAYKNSDAQLSMAGVTQQVSNFNNHLDLTVLKTFRYVSIFLGLDPNMVHWSHSAVVAAWNLFSASFLTAFMTFVFVWDEILLKFIDQKLYAHDQQIILNVFRGISNLIFDSLQNNKMKNMVFAPAKIFCNRLPHVTLDSAGPLGQTLFHGCRAVVEWHYALVRTFSNMVVFSDISNCVCSVRNEDNLQNCVDILPDSIQMHYQSYWSKKTLSNYEQRLALCTGFVDIFRANLMEMPARYFRHIDLALMSLNNVPSEVAGYFGMEPELRQICTETAFDAVQQLTSITPQPISAFKRCGYTKSCQQKCAVDILQFEVEKAKAANPNRAITGQYKMSIPTTFEDIEGMSEQDPFEPVAVAQLDVDEGENTGCIKNIVVVARTLQQGRLVATERKWMYHSICVVLTAEGLTYMKLTRSGVLEHAQEFFLYSEVEGLNTETILEKQRSHHQIIDVSILHTKQPGDVFTVLLVAWEKMSYKNGVYRIDVDSRGEERSAWILDSVFVADKFVFENSDDSELMLDEKPALSGDVSFPFNPVFTHVSVLPGISEKRGEFSLLFTLRLHVMVDKTMKRVESRSTVGIALTTENEDQLIVQSHQSWDNPYDSTPGSLGWLAYKKIYYDGSVAISQGASGVWNVLVFESTKPYAVISEMTAETYLLTYNTTEHKYELTASDAEEGFNLKSAFFSAGNIFRGMGLHEYERSPTVFSSPCRNRVLTLAEPVRDRNIFLYSSIGCKSVSSNSGDPWFMEMRIEKNTDSDEFWKVVVEDKLGMVENVEIEAECSYMSCFKCSDRELQKRCYAAENCATRKCIATTFNHQNLFCVGGGILKETIEYIMSDTKVAFYAFVEFYIGVFSFTQKNLNKQTIDIQSLSDYYVNRFCELKDISALVSSVIPAIFSTVYHVQRIRIQSSRSISRRDLDFISPKNQFRVRGLTTYVTEVIHSILLGVPHYLFARQKLVLCGADKLAELSGGVVNILDNTIGSEETNICIFSSFETSTAKVPTDNEIITQNMLRDFGGVQKSVKIERNGGKIQRVLVSLASAGPSLIMISKYYNRFVILNEINTAVDWVVGIMQSVARLVSAFDPMECRPYASDIKYQSQCVCNDDVYAITQQAAGQLAENGALWCSGVLELVDGAGTMKYVYNPYSFQYLKQKLDSGTNSKLYQYLECIGMGEGACTQLDNLDSVFSRWMHNGINPLSVLTRCRDNFAGKIFDRGAFLIYNEEMQEIIQQQRSSHAVSKSELLQLQEQLNDLMSEETQHCLQGGPKMNSIGGCMFLFFEQNKLKTQGIPHMQTVSAYFEYEKITETETQGHDACGYLSTPAFAIGPGEFADDIRACQQESGTFCNTTLYGVPCRILYNTNTLASGSSTNVVDTYQTKASGYSPETDFENVAACAQNTMNHYLDSAKDLLKDTQFEFKSVEGDFFHQFIDCILLGPYNKVEALPADIQGILESLVYSRDQNASSRDFEFPCAQKTLYSDDGAIFESRTCGTDPRVSAVSYILSVLQDDPSTGINFVQVIMNKLQEVKNELTNRNLYACNNPCCTQWNDETCHVWDVSFAPRFNFDMTINISSFVQQGIGDLDLQYKAISDVKVCSLHLSCL
tara:strand:- start:24615 stop:32462 length:7848 start_codon:yes stop_codon:yes gene_type:complete